MDVSLLRREYHRQICLDVARLRLLKNEANGIECPNFADGSNVNSVRISQRIIQKIGFPIKSEVLVGQTTGQRFEEITRIFIEQCFSGLNEIRPGNWKYETHRVISDFEQYEHLAYIGEAIKNNPELSSTFGQDYIITPDIIVSRHPISDDQLLQMSISFGNEHQSTRYSPLREVNQKNRLKELLHAVISCKWTIRSDRSQNTRTEALNLIRNHKGNLPHIMAITAEPLPTRIASIALGTGDLDCVYHFALHELIEALEEDGNQDQQEMLSTMINGKRLRDISDLPFDLAI